MSVSSSIVLAHLKIKITLCHLLCWLIKTHLSNWRSWEKKGRMEKARNCCKAKCSSTQGAGLRWLVPFVMCSQPIYIFSRQSPASVRCSKDGAHLMSSQITLCFPVFVQCVALGLIDNTLFKPCSEDRIIDFLVVFFYHSSIWALIIIEPKCFTNINLSLQHPWEERAALGSLLIQRGWQCAQIGIRSIH